MMQRAADAGHSVSYSGRQSFLAYRDGGAIVAQVDVDARAGQGSQVRVNSQSGQQLLKGFTPALISSRVVDDELLGLLERNYRLSGTRGASVAGRSATVVTATRDGSPPWRLAGGSMTPLASCSGKRPTTRADQSTCRSDSPQSLSAMRRASWNICRRDWQSRGPARRSPSHPRPN